MIKKTKLKREEYTIHTNTKTILPTTPPPPLLLQTNQYKNFKKEGENLLYMTETFYRTGHYTPDTTKFGGIINLSDFYTNCGGHLNTHGSLIAQHIISEWKFD